MHIFTEIIVNNEVKLSDYLSKIQLCNVQVLLLLALDLLDLKHSKFDIWNIRGHRPHQTLKEMGLTFP